MGRPARVQGDSRHGQYGTKLGYETREVRPLTAVTRLEAGTEALRPWKDIPEVGPEVSGVGEYSTTLQLDHQPLEGTRYLLDLGSTAGGLGLGLSIVKHVAANHNGSIRLWSQPGTGSTFTLSIPAYPQGDDDPEVHVERERREEQQDEGRQDGRGAAPPGPKEPSPAGPRR